MASQRAQRRLTARRRHSQTRQGQFISTLGAADPVPEATLRRHHRLGYWLGRTLLAGIFVVPLAVGYWKLFHPAP